MRIGLMVLLLFSAFISGAQNHYVYIQADRKQNFSVAVDKKTFRSEKNGYLIIPQLTPGNKELVISFPEAEVQPQHIWITINSDRGYLLKNFGEKGFGLFDLRDMSITMNGLRQPESIASKDISAVNPESQQPSTTAASATQNPHIGNANADTAISTVVTPKAVSVKTDTIENTRVFAYIQGDYNITNSGANPAAQMKADRSGAINMISRSGDASGLVARYQVKNDTYDTVQIFLPGDYSVYRSSSEKVQVVDHPSNPEQKNNNIATTEQSVIKAGSIPANNCSALATEDDFYALRKALAGKASADKMMGIANKAFRKACYSTLQLRSLSGNFLSEESRFEFVLAAKDHVSDPQNFRQLADAFVTPEFKEKVRNLQP